MRTGKRWRNVLTSARPGASPPVSSSCQGFCARPDRATRRVTLITVSAAAANVAGTLTPKQLNLTWKKRLYENSPDQSRPGPQL